MDQIEEADLFKLMEMYNNEGIFKGIVPISALKGRNVKELMKVIGNYLEEGPKYFPDYMITDQPERVLVSELIREKVLHYVHDEVPHGVAVEIERMKFRKDQNIVDISAVICCERPSHKGIIIGKNGRKLKGIGKAAREDMERKSYDICAADYDEDGHETEESSYNEYGDYVLYRPNSTKEGPIYGLPVNYTVNAFPQDTYIDSINAEFQKFMDEGIKVYFTYSPRNKYALSKESTEEERARLHEYFKSQLHIPVISELEDSLCTGIYLYGTDNHLSTEGAQIRTERVIRDLKEQLAKEEKE